MTDHVTVNGTPHPLPASASLADLLARVTAVPDRGVAVALNGTVVPRREWATTAVTAGDRVEVLVAAQGG